jgi:hypothetical protein
MPKFKKGQSGNPAGRKAGSRNQATLISKELLDDEPEKITRKAIELAIAGDVIALRLCLERIYPKPKDMAIKTKLPVINTAADIPLAIAKIFQMIGNGKLTIDQGKTLAGIAAAQGNFLEMAELEKRIAVLEGKNDIKNG